MSGTNTMLAIVCNQQGAEEAPDENYKEWPPNEPRSPGVALDQQGKENKGVGANATAGAAKQRGIRKNRRGEPIVCFNCGKNHPFLECPDIPLKKRKEIMASKSDE